MLNFAKNKAKIEPKIVVNKNNRNFAKKWVKIAWKVAKKGQKDFKKLETHDFENSNSKAYWKLCKKFQKLGKPANLVSKIHTVCKNTPIIS